MSRDHCDGAATAVQARSRRCCCCCDRLRRPRRSRSSRSRRLGPGSTDRDGWRSESSIIETRPPAVIVGRGGARLSHGAGLRRDDLAGMSGRDGTRSAGLRTAATTFRRPNSPHLTHGRTVDDRPWVDGAAWVAAATYWIRNRYRCGDPVSDPDAGDHRDFAALRVGPNRSDAAERRESRGARRGAVLPLHGRHPTVAEAVMRASHCRRRMI